MLYQRKKAKQRRGHRDADATESRDDVGKIISTALHGHRKNNRRLHVPEEQFGKQHEQSFEGAGVMSKRGQCHPSVESRKRKGVNYANPEQSNAKVKQSKSASMNKDQSDDSGRKVWMEETNSKSSSSMRLSAIRKSKKIRQQIEKEEKRLMKGRRQWKPSGKTSKERGGADRATVSQNDNQDSIGRCIV